MTTPQRFTDDPGFLVYRNGRLIHAPDGVNPDRVAARSRALRRYYATGDDQELVAQGVLSPRTDRERAYRAYIRALEAVQQ